MTRVTGSHPDPVPETDTTDAPPTQPKATGGDGDVVLVVLAGQDGDVRDGVKVPAAVAVMHFAGTVLGCQVVKGRCLYAMRLPNRQGDHAWLRENVFRVCDPVGVVIQDAESLGQRMAGLFEEAGGTADKVGVGTVTKWLDDMYMRYDVLPRGVLRCPARGTCWTRSCRRLRRWRSPRGSLRR